MSAILNPNDFGKFADLIGSGDKTPSRSNLFEIVIDPPTAMYSAGGRFGTALDGINKETASRSLDVSQKDYYDYINYFADSVTVPGRRLTVGSVRDVGAMRRFATDTSFSEMQISFLVTQDYWHRKFFERWMNFAASDAENRVNFYREYVTTIKIIKWEVASNYVGVNRKNGVTYKSRLNGVTGAWTLYGAFPFDMSSLSLNNGPTDLLKLDISFYYERYRFDTVNGRRMFSGNEKDRELSMESANVLGALQIDPQLTDITAVGI